MVFTFDPLGICTQRLFCSPPATVISLEVVETEHRTLEIQVSCCLGGPRPTSLHRAASPFLHCGCFAFCMVMCSGDLAPLHLAPSRSIPGNGENPEDLLDQEWSTKSVVALMKTLL